MTRALLIVEDPRLLADAFRAALSDALAYDLAHEVETMAADDDGASAWQLDFASAGDEGLARVLEQLDGDARYGLIGIDCAAGRGPELAQALWAVDPELRIVLRLNADDDSWRWLDDRWGTRGRLLVVSQPVDGAELRRLAAGGALGWARARHTHLKLRQLHGLVREQAPDGRWHWDLARNRIDYSPRWKALVGQSDGDVGAAPAEWLDRVHSDDRPGVERAVAAHLGGRSPELATEFRMRHRDGSLRWMAVRGQAERASARLSGVLHDVGDRRQAEAQLRLLGLDDVPAANDRDEDFVTESQPLRALVDLRTGRVAGLELRPQTPLLRLADAEPVGDWLLGAALRELARLELRGERDLALTIVVEAAQLVRPGFVERVAERRAQAGLGQRRLRLAVSERALAALPALDELTARLVALDVGLSVSDFGAGSAALAWLGRLPVEALQLDDAIDSQLVRAATALGHALDVAVLVDAGPELGADPEAEPLRAVG